jgi:hypothetical protein
VDALYELARAYYPNEADLFGDAYTYRQSSVVVPVQLRALLGNSTASFNIGLGGYYGYRFGGIMREEDGLVLTHYDPQHQYGIVWSYEMRVANLSYAFTWYYQLNDLITPPDGSILPSSQKNTFTFTMGFYF